MQKQKKEETISCPNQIIISSSFFTENLMAIDMTKIQILMNKPGYLGLTILEISKTVMHEFWYNYVKSKYSEKPKLCYMETDSFIIFIKTDETYSDITADAETRFGTSDYVLQKPIPEEKNKKTIGLMKDESGGKLIT